jgi:hypothetical protein
VVLVDDAADGAYGRIAVPGWRIEIVVPLLIVPKKESHLMSNAVFSNAPFPFSISPARDWRDGLAW